MRNYYAICFILFAYIIVFGHDIMPHQHCKSHICIETKKCENQDSNHDCNSKCSSKHSDNSEEIPCVLKHTVALPLNQCRVEIKDLVSEVDYLFFNRVVFSFVENTFGVPVFSTKRNICLYQSEYLNSSIGLRAPPRL